MSPDDNIFLAARAVLLPTKSVIRVLPYFENHSRYFKQDHYQPIIFSQKQVSKICRFITSDFALNDKGQLIPADDSRNFFMSNSVYWVLHTCNVWTARALKKGGFNIIPVLNFSANRLLKKIKRKQKDQ